LYTDIQICPVNVFREELVLDYTNYTKILLRCYLIFGSVTTIRAISRLHLSARIQVRSRANQCEIFSSQTVIETGFGPSTSVFVPALGFGPSISVFVLALGFGPSTSVVVRILPFLKKYFGFCTATPVFTRVLAFYLNTPVFLCSYNSSATLYSCFSVIYHIC
jgi:hypothetical protein